MARPLLLVVMLLTTSLPATGQLPSAAEAGLSGTVFGLDGTPVTGGDVALEARTGRVTAGIERSGRYRVVPSIAGLHQLTVTVPQFATYRVDVTVPPSRTAKLPDIRLSLPTYFRARFVTRDGEPIMSPQVRRRSLDVYGMPIREQLETRVQDQIESDGTITIGPLPRGVTTMALDLPGLAQTRLPDLYVDGSKPLLDGGAVTVQPGAVLTVEVVDAAGAPVARHDVAIEDAAPLSPLAFRPRRTNEKGLVAFERLGAGRYRLWTRAIERCGSQTMTIARIVAVPGSGTARTRLVVGGNVSLRLTSPFGPMRGVQVVMSPDASPSPVPRWLRERTGSPATIRLPTGFGGYGTSSCAGATDADGRLALANFPPGPAQVRVLQLNSTYVAQVTVPEDGREIQIVVPDGYLPLRVVNAIKNTPIASAEIKWTGPGGRVEARTAAAGEALLEGVGATGGTLAISALGFQPGEDKLTEQPATLLEVALLPSPSDRVELRVVNASGQPIANAVVHFEHDNPIDVGHIAVTDAKGLIVLDAPPGGLRVTADAEGFAPATIRLADDKREASVITLR